MGRGGRAIPDDVGTHHELVAVLGVHDEVEVALTVAGLGVGEAGEGLGEHVEAGGEDLGLAGRRGAYDDLVGEDGEFTSLGAAGVADDADDVASLDVAVDLGEGLEALLVVGGGGHDLEGLALALEGVEDELAAGGSLEHDTAGDVDELLGDVLAVAEMAVLLNELGDADGDLELVGVPVASGGLDLGDLGAAVLEVLGGVELLLILGLLGLVGLLGLLLGELLGLLLGGELGLHSSLELVLAELL